jgi:division protein CdvB (Snf7/Vps24/ESCRT-III family)
MEAPLKPRLDVVMWLIKQRIQELSQGSERIARRDKILFGRIIEFHAKHEVARVQMCIDELTEVRKIARVILRSLIALKKTLSRAEAVSEYGLAATRLTPAAYILRAISFQLKTVFPVTGFKVDDLRERLSAIIVDAGMLTGSVSFESARKVAEEIMAEVDKTVDQTITSELPPLPDLNPISL